MKKAAVLLFLLGGVTTGAHAQAPLVIPDCDALRAWVAGIPAGPGRGGTETPEMREARERQYSDERIAELFGRAAPQWNESDRQRVRAAASACHEELRQRGDPQGAAQVSAAIMRLYKQSQSVGTQASADLRLRTPDCATVAAWADAGWNAPDGTSHEQRMTRMFEDTATAGTFGIPYSRWDANDMLHASRIIGRCHGELFPRGGGGQGGTSPYTSTAMQAAVSRLMGRAEQLQRGP
jgi:hypothetical protein